MSKRKRLFGQWLKKTRKANDLSQRDLADRLGVNYTYISKIECATVEYIPSRDFLSNLYDVFGGSMETILDAAGYYDRSLLDAMIDQRPQLARQLRGLYAPDGDE